MIRKGTFFFSSRRRHTRWPRDWSSDVCSSDLWAPNRVSRHIRDWAPNQHSVHRRRLLLARSEERRVGKECRSRWSWGYEKKNNAMLLDTYTDDFMIYI